MSAMIDTISNDESDKLQKTENEEEIPKFLDRYSRQEILIQKEGQEILKKSKVLIVGCGGLGSPVAIYLAGAGIGTLGLLDNDTVSVTNLHRQILHNEKTEGLPKVDSAESMLESFNSEVKLEKYNCQLTEQNGTEIVSKYDVIVDCCDNFPTRLLLNDACVITGKPLVFGCAVKWEGQLTVFNYPPNKGPCYRCLFPNIPTKESQQFAANVGVVGPVPGIIGCMQASEVIKVLLGYNPESDVLCSRMLIMNAKTMSFRVAKMRGKVQNCPSCSCGLTHLKSYKSLYS